MILMSGRQPKPGCTCDLPTCVESWVCKQLGEYRIVHRVLTEMQKMRPHVEMETIADALYYVEGECEILVK